MLSNNHNPELQGKINDFIRRKSVQYPDLSANPDGIVHDL